MESEFDLRVYLAILRRRLVYLLIPAVIIGLGGVVVANVLPPTYQASATILVETQQIPSDLASSTVTAGTAQRIQVIQQRLLARDNLLQIAAKYDLYADQGASRTPTTIVDAMRAAIGINQIDADAQAARSGFGVIGFTVTFEYRNPTIASRVTNELVSSMLSQNIETRMSSASETAKFLEQQKTDIEKRLQDLELKIADFKRAHEEDLPETLDSRRQQFALLTTQLGEIDQRISVINAAGGNGALAADSAGVQQLTFTLQAKQLELASLRERHDRLAPLVEKGVIAKNQFRDLDNQVAIAELNVTSLQAQIAAQGGAPDSDQAKRLLAEQRGALQAQIDILKQNISNTPSVEVQLNQLNRDYANLKSEYDQAQAKFEDAQTGQRLEQDRQAERFEVIDQPTVPDTPTSPNQPRIIIAAGVGGVAAGFALVVLSEMLDKSIYSGLDLERRLQLRPIATIPYVVTKRERRGKTGRFLILILVALGVIVVLLVAVDIYYLPLDLIAQRLWMKISGWLPMNS